MLVDIDDVVGVVDTKAGKEERKVVSQLQLFLAKVSEVASHLMDIFLYLDKTPPLGMGTHSAESIYLRKEIIID